MSMHRLIAMMVLFIACTFSSIVQAGPYHKKDPYPIHVRAGGGFESTGRGGVVGGSAMVDYNLGHFNERYSVYLGARGHGYMGPLSTGFGDNYHLAGFAVVRWQVQVDSLQSISPYVIVGPGFLAYSGHPDKDGEHSAGMGPALEADVGVLGYVSKRLSWYAELGLVAAYPRAAYMRMNVGVQYAFGSDGIQREPR